MTEVEITEVSQRALLAQGVHDIDIYPPQAIINQAREAARALSNVLSGKSTKVMFRGEQFLEFEDWQTIGRFYGVSVRTFGAEPVEIEGVKGAKARADLLDKNSMIVGGAEAFCMRNEGDWANKPWNQMASMAQTRAGAKALRNKFAWVAVLAGCKPTPAEEMGDAIEREEDFSEKVSDKQRKRFFAIAHSSGKTEEQIKAYLQSKIQSEHTADITRAVYDEVCSWAAKP